MSAAAEWWFVSDLHLDTAGTPPSGRDVAAAMRGFLESTVHVSRSPRRHLVLLGDVLELHPSGGQPRDPVRRLEALAARHGELFETLAECMRAGVTLDVVSGNHDPALTRLDVQQALGRCLGATASQCLRFHPWMLHEPGVLYAEHGHQHHDLNRVPALLDGDAGSGQPSPLRTWAEGRERPVTTRAVDVGRALHRTRRWEVMTTEAPYVRLLHREARRQGLPAGAVLELSRVSAFHAPRAVVRTAGRLAGRRLGVSRPGGYMQRAAADVHAVLAAHGCAVPAYVFGHTHRAETVPIAGGAARYLNSGTWGPDVRGPGPDQGDRNLFPYVFVRAVDGTVESAVSYWDASAKRAVTKGGRP